MNVQTRQKMEKDIALSIVSQALGHGFCISVNDGAETTLKYSSNVDAIMNAMFTTDEDILKFYISEHSTNERAYAGFVHLIYGNTGYDVISDYTAIDEIETMLTLPIALASRLEEKYYNRA